MSDRRQIGIHFHASIEVGHRIALRPDGSGEPAAADDPGVGINVTNACAGRTTIVRLYNVPDVMRVQGPVDAGAGLYPADKGVFAAKPSSSDRPTAIALSSVGNVSARIYAMPLTKEDGVPASATGRPSPASSQPRTDPPAPKPASPANPPAMRRPSAPWLAPAPRKYDMTNPIAQVFHRRSELVAAGVAPGSAMERVFSEDPALQMAYARAVRSDPSEIGQAINAEVERLVAEKMAGGMSNAAAVFATWRKDPDLQSRFVAASRQAPPQSRAVQSAPARQSAGATRPGKPACVAEVERRVEALKSRGVDHAEAVCRVFKADAALHRQFMEAHNVAR